jgi:hypothetical protein
MPPIPRELRATLDEVANALQRAIGLTTTLRHGAQGTADDAVALEAAISRAVTALRRLQPPILGGTDSGGAL